MFEEKQQRERLVGSSFCLEVCGGGVPGCSGFVSRVPSPAFPWVPVALFVLWPGATRSSAAMAFRGLLLLLVLVLHVPLGSSGPEGDAPSSSNTTAGNGNTNAADDAATRVETTEPSRLQVVLEAMIRFMHQFGESAGHTQADFEIESLALEHQLSQMSEAEKEQLLMRSSSTLLGLREHNRRR